jgi:tetratricopeptide (TPR) repeat protein
LAAPADAHVIEELQTVLREGGRPEEVVALAKERSEASEAGLDERSLLLAGATAERSGNPNAARRAYEQVLRQTPDSPPAALALLDVTRDETESALHLRAYESLADGSLGGGVPQLFALLHADAVGWTGAPSRRASALYERALDHDTTEGSAAIGLLSSPASVVTEDQRAAAEEVLADAGALLSEPRSGFDGAFTTLCDALEREGASSGDAWLELAKVAPTDELRASAILQGLRDIRISRGEQAADEIFMLAQESADLATRRPEAAIAVEEALTPSEDAELRCAAFERALGYGGELGRTALDAARCRALVEADRGPDAVASLTAAIDRRPDDLSLWETLRRAARQSGEWALVAQACERLAPFVEGTIKADLLEEAGVVRLDCLQQLAQAEDLFRAALEVDPTRDEAFRRLHDLLSAREDAEALDALVAERLALGGPKDRPGLLYERARLLRGFSDRPGALEVLDELFAAEPEHSGALALAAEVHVSLERWEEAVDCLRRLSKSSIPDEQRRVAHLGAADFLQAKLGRNEEALAELRAVEALGLADVDTWLRIGELEEVLENSEAAVEAYLEALGTEPDHDTAIERVAALAKGDVRDGALARYEHAAWARIEEGALDETVLEGLRKVAHWRGHLERALAIGAVESALESRSPNGDARTDLSHVSMASIWDRDASTRIDDLLALAAPGLPSPRGRAKKLGADDPAHSELEQLTERYGGRFGSAGATDRPSALGGSLGRDGELHWVVPRAARNGLDGVERFRAARLAWALPRGAGALVAESPEKAAGFLAGVLRAAQRPPAPGEPILPAVTVKLRRSVRKSIQRAAGDAPLQPSELIAAARRIQRTADRAGLLASGDIHAALMALCEGPPSMHALRSSSRAVDLLRFWMGADSPLWRHDV